jgi:Kef-type K+ transport system membrane component KefB
VVGFAYLRLRVEAVHETPFVAAAMVATSVGITARVLHDLRVLKIRASLGRRLLSFSTDNG